MRFLLRIAVARLCCRHCGSRYRRVRTLRRPAARPDRAQLRRIADRGSISAAAESRLLHLHRRRRRPRPVRIAETSGTLGTLRDRPPSEPVGRLRPRRRRPRSTALVNAAGTWTINVQDAAGNRTGNYRIAIQRLNNPLGCTAITHDRGVRRPRRSASPPRWTATRSPASRAARSFASASPRPEPRPRSSRATTSSGRTARSCVRRRRTSTSTASSTAPVRTRSSSPTTPAPRPGPTRSRSAGSTARPAAPCSTLARRRQAGRSPRPPRWTASASTARSVTRSGSAPLKTSGTLAVSRRSEFVRPDGTTFPFSVCCVQLDATGTHKIIVGDSNGTGQGSVPTRSRSSG